MTVFPKVRSIPEGLGQWMRKVQEAIIALERAPRGGSTSGSTASTAVPSKINAVVSMVNGAATRCVLVATDVGFTVSLAGDTDPFLNYTSGTQDTTDPSNPIAIPADITFTFGDQTVTLSSILTRLHDLDGL